MKKKSERFSLAFPVGTLAKMQPQADRGGHTIASLSRKIILDWLEQQIPPKRKGG